MKVASTMRIIFAGGGTAGHINPALAVAEYVKEVRPGAQLLYVGAVGGMEEKLVKQAGLDFSGIKISGFSRKLNLAGLKKNIITLKRVVTASLESKRIIEQFAPDICVGTGGYVSGPILRKAAQMGVPIIIHEQNAFPGITTKMLAHKAECVMLAVGEARKFFDKRCKIAVTGNPIRKEIAQMTQQEARAKLKLDNRPVVLSFGGSLGARKINEAVVELIADTAKTDKFQHIHAFGQYGQWFLPELEKRGVKISAHPNLDVREYISDMPTCLAAADLVICRAGAITLSEIQAQGKASILIPSPNVAENHQYHNAMALVNNHAAGILEERDLTGELLIKKVNELLAHPETMREFQQNAKKMAIYDANQRIYSIIEKIVG